MKWKCMRSCLSRFHAYEYTIKIASNRSGILTPQKAILDLQLDPASAASLRALAGSRELAASFFWHRDEFYPPCDAQSCEDAQSPVGQSRFVGGF
jgi:hypothetical protein